MAAGRLPPSPPQGPTLRPRGPNAARSPGLRLPPGGAGAAPPGRPGNTARPGPFFILEEEGKKKNVKKQRSVGSLIQGDRRTGVSRGKVGAGPCSRERRQRERHGEGLRILRCPKGRPKLGTWASGNTQGHWRNGG